MCPPNAPSACHRVLGRPPSRAPARSATLRARRSCRGRSRSSRLLERDGESTAQLPPLPRRRAGRASRTSSSRSPGRRLPSPPPPEAQCLDRRISPARTLTQWPQTRRYVGLLVVIAVVDEVIVEERRHVNELGGRREAPALSSIATSTSARAAPWAEHRLPPARRGARRGRRRGHARGDSLSYELFDVRISRRSASERRRARVGSIDTGRGRRCRGARGWRRRRSWLTTAVRHIDRNFQKYLKVLYEPVSPPVKARRHAACSPPQTFGLFTFSHLSEGHFPERRHRRTGQLGRKREPGLQARGQRRRRPMERPDRKREQAPMVPAPHPSDTRARPLRRRRGAARISRGKGGGAAGRRGGDVPGRGRLLK